MDISKMDISDDDELQLIASFLSNNKKKKNKNTIKKKKLSKFQWPSDSDSDNEETMQRAIMFSLHTLEQEQDTKQKRVIHPCTLSPLSSLSIFPCFEQGSTSSPLTCVICLDIVVPKDRICITPCCHVACMGCLSRYLGEKVNEDVRQVACPGPKCVNVLREKIIERFLPDEVYHRWDLAMLERSVLEYTLCITCPFEGCGRQIVNDKRGYSIRACTCCWRLFCYKCRAGWHMGMTCQQFKRREEEAYARRMLIIRQREEEEESEKKRKEYALKNEEELMLIYITDDQIIAIKNGLKTVLPWSNLSSDAE